MALIELDNVVKIFGPKPEQALGLIRQGYDKDRLKTEADHTLGLDHVSLSIEAGETFVIMGLSGSGKSTLVRHLNRLIEPTAGRIIIDGDDVTAMSAARLQDFRRHRIGMVFQRFALMPHRTVLENAAYGLEVQGMAKAERHRKAADWLTRVGLSGYEGSYPSHLSGGMQQRVGLARALAGDADILLLDEAFSALDPLIRRDMQDQLVELQRELKKTLVFITHDLDEALRLGDRIAILRDGRLIQTGRPEEILLNPADDYVDDFVRDVNRARVLMAGTIQTPATLLPVSACPNDIVKATAKLFYKVAYMVDVDGRLAGIVSADQARRAAGTDLRPLVKPVLTVTPEQILADIMPQILRSDAPVAVVNDRGQPQGIISRKTALRAMMRE